MKNSIILRGKTFIEQYFQAYANREICIKDHYADDFIGLDGISTKIYDKNTWITALNNDFEEVKEPFKIKIITIELRPHLEDSLIAVVISLWCIPIFENSPEFDKMRSVLVLKPNGKSFKISHLSNSVSLLPLNSNDVYPTELLDFLKKSKESYFKLGKL
ncbi:MAG: nuclear transport factor 2 family protein [Psychroserpens sp.]|uniref:nuclear transport factor 2 family protein n=1 Tax=Psychroserpens sp. TaxID=2020870 RepID=UPI003C75DC32